MKIVEYNAMKESLETRYREGMAALETLWVSMNGSQPPGSVVAVETDGAEEVPGGDRGLRSAESIGAQSAARISGMHQERRKRQSTAGLTDEQKKARKAAYMKTYLAKRKADGK